MTTAPPRVWGNKVRAPPPRGLIRKLRDWFDSKANNTTSRERACLSPSFSIPRPVVFRLSSPPRSVVLFHQPRDPFFPPLNARFARRSRFFLSYHFCVFSPSWFWLFFFRTVSIFFSLHGCWFDYFPCLLHLSVVVSPCFITGILAQCEEFEFSKVVWINLMN